MDRGGNSSDDESVSSKRQSMLVEDVIADKKDEQIHQLLEKVKQLESDLSHSYASKGELPNERG